MPAKRVQLCLVIHNHQPVGNFDHVIRDACERAYLPFLRTLLDFPQIKIGLHTSGCLLEWMETGCPEYFELVRELLKRGQLELLGGGMYEPILPVLPDEDARQQLDRMTNFLGEHFGIRPSGMWLPERVWEPHLAELIAWQDLGYTLLDDHHFRGCALPDDVARNYFTTQHAAGRIALLPISEKLRYTMPFKPVEATFEHLDSLASSSGSVPLQAFGDDGEKFGVWPETHVWVYEKGWLRDFLTKLTESLTWIDLLLPADVLRSRQPAGDVYIPCSAYKEMGDWTRFDPTAPETDPPGHWRNYLSKYSEVQALYDRMVQVSWEMQYAEHDVPAKELWVASRHLYRGQCNCAYWHGVFGGLYLNNLRHAINSELLLAERIIFDKSRSALAACGSIDAFDGQWRLISDQVNVQVNLQHGLCIDRLDQYAPPFVWTNVLTRRKEHYHRKLGAEYVPDEHASIHDRVITKEEGLEDRLVYDPHPRSSFNCYVASAVESPEQFLSRGAADKAGWRRTADDNSVKPTELKLGFPISATVVLGSLGIRKTAELAGSKLELSIELVGGAFDNSEELLWVEFNFNVLTDKAADRYLLIGGKRHSLAAGYMGDMAELRLCDGWQQRQLVLTSGQRATLVAYPIYTVSSSEGGFERTYQGSCFMLGYSQSALTEGISLAIEIEDFNYAG
jgi:hypothetical protein